jgi:hypothetical protein
MLEVDDALRSAAREWRRMGVRRRTVVGLVDELRVELESASADAADLTVVTGPDVRAFAREWALDREDVQVSPRYLRFVAVSLFGLVLGGSVAAGFIALVQFAARIVVDNGAYDLFASADGIAILGAYLATGATGYVGALFAARWALRRAGDPHSRRSTRALAITLPIAAVVATASAVGVAASSGYNAAPRYVTIEFLLVFAILLAAITAARWIGVRNSKAQESRQVTNGSVDGILPACRFESSVPASAAPARTR